MFISSRESAVGTGYARIGHDLRGRMALGMQTVSGQDRGSEEWEACHSLMLTLEAKEFQWVKCCLVAK